MVFFPPQPNDHGQENDELLQVDDKLLNNFYQFCVFQLHPDLKMNPQVKIHNVLDFARLPDIPKNQKLSLTTDDVPLSEGYWYDDDDMYTFSSLSLEKLGLSHIAEVWAPVDTSSLPVDASSLKDGSSKCPELERILTQIQKHPKNTHLIPCNIGGNHWIGLLLTTSGTKLVSAQYCDSLSYFEETGIYEEINNTLQKTFNSDLKLKNNTHYLQSDFSSCGPCTVENLIFLAKGASHGAENSSDFRQAHLSLLKQKSESAQDPKNARFYKAKLTKFLNEKNTLDTEKTKEYEKIREERQQENQLITDLIQKLSEITPEAQDSLQRALSAFKRYQEQTTAIKALRYFFNQKDTLIDIANIVFKPSSEEPTNLASASLAIESETLHSLSSIIPHLKTLKEIENLDFENPGNVENQNLNAGTDFILALSSEKDHLNLEDSWLIAKIWKNHEQILKNLSPYLAEGYEEIHNFIAKLLLQLDLPRTMMADAFVRYPSINYDQSFFTTTEKLKLLSYQYHKNLLELKNHYELELKNIQNTGNKNPHFDQEQKAIYQKIINTIKEVIAIQFPKKTSFENRPPIAKETIEIIQHAIYSTNDAIKETTLDALADAYCDMHSSCITSMKQSKVNLSPHRFH